MAGSHDREHRVRVRAYHLWEAEGRPEGREAEFWHRAAELDHLESAAGQDASVTSQQEPEPAAPAAPVAKKPRAKAAPAAPAPKETAKEAASPKPAAPRKRASTPATESAPKTNSARARTRPAEHP